MDRDHPTDWDGDLSPAGGPPGPGGSRGDAADVDAREVTLDPTDWEAMRSLGHRMVDDMLETMRRVRERPVWRHAPAVLRDHFSGGPPRDPLTAEGAYDDFKRLVLPYPFGNDHPRFWGWVLGNGTPLAALTEFLAAAMNSNTGGVDYHSANHVEAQVVDWIKQMLGYPPEASGLLTSGGSASNLIGLAVARHAKAPWDVRQDGLQEAPARLLVYASDQIHSSIQKGVELLGLGSRSLRLVPSDTRFMVDVRAMRSMIERDRAAGHLPFCVVGAAGTTDTGAIDDLSALADLAGEHDLWFHVDGAFGAWAALAPRLRHLVRGLERADSLAVDLHKWMYLPYEIGCVLVRDEAVHRATFTLTPAYLAHGEGGRGMTGGDLPWFQDYGFELSRSFRALKAWMSLKAHGVDTFARLIQQNVDQARYLGALVDAAPELQLVAPVSLNVVAFRYVGTGSAALSGEATDAASLDELNRAIVVELQEAGLVVPSGSVVRGVAVIHVANTNHRSRREDFDLLVREVVRVGDELSRGSHIGSA